MEIFDNINALKKCLSVANDFGECSDTTEYDKLSESMFKFSEVVSKINTASMIKKKNRFLEITSGYLNEDVSFTGLTTDDGVDLIDTTNPLFGKLVKVYVKTNVEV